MMDEKTKEALRQLHHNMAITQSLFPMEPLVVYAGKEQITTNSGDTVWMWAHKQVAKPIFIKQQVLDAEAFELVDWKSYWTAMQSFPQLFQIWACKQIMSIAATNKAHSWYTEDLSPLCPSCAIEEETCAHILKCMEQGMVQVLETLIGLLDQWLQSTYTDSQLHQLLVSYTCTQGMQPMIEFCYGMQQYMKEFAQTQDTIGWRRFMEGLVAKQVKLIQQNYWKCTGW